MGVSENAQAAISFKHGNKFPYDAPDDWWEAIDHVPPPPDDWAHAAARGIIADLKGRKGIKHGFQELPEDIRIDIVTSLANIIRTASPGGSSR